MNSKLKIKDTKGSKTKLLKLYSMKKQATKINKKSTT